jgi:hypothetical protein
VSISIDELPTIENAGRLGRRVDSPVADAYRLPSNPVADLVGAVGIAKVLEFGGVLQQKLLPRAAQLAELRVAAGPSYSQHFDCGGFFYEGTCDEACFGFAPHHMDPFYCATCPEQAADPVNNPSYNWHFVGSRGQIQYMDREPDVCAGHDAWKWDVGPCGSCAQAATFRCHDGWKKYPDNNYWDPTICQGLVVCDQQLTVC